MVCHLPPVRQSAPRLLAAGLLAAALVVLHGCSSLLPSSKDETLANWHHYDEVKAAYERILPGTTEQELVEFGFDLNNTPNLEILSYLDVAAMIQGIPTNQLAPGLQECLQARDGCRAYVYELQRLKSERVGNFWADFFNFRRETDISGWRFKMLLVMINGRVVYKLWSGSPAIEKHRQERNPLGPLQDSGDRLLRLVN